MGCTTVYPAVITIRDTQEWASHVPSSAIGSAVTLLQLYNAIMLNAFWPFFAAIAVLLMIAMLQFVRLVLISGELK